MQIFNDNIQRQTNLLLYKYAQIDEYTATTVYSGNTGVDAAQYICYTFSQKDVKGV